MIRELTLCLLVLLAVGCARTQKQDSTARVHKTVCTSFSSYLSDGITETKIQTPERFNHLFDDPFERMGYRMTSCSEAQIRLSQEMRLIQRGQEPPKVTVRIAGTGNGRVDKFEFETSPAEYQANEDEVLGKAGFGMVKVMETLEPGFMERYDQVFGSRPSMVRKFLESWLAFSSFMWKWSAVWAVLAVVIGLLRWLRGSNRSNG